MAVACFSLIGLPLTVGFFAKFYLIGPMLQSKNYWLAIIVVINAVIGAVYYLKIVGTMFLRPEPAPAVVGEPVPSAHAFVHPFPIVLAVGLSTAATLLFGIVLPATQDLTTRASIAATPALPYTDVTTPTASLNPLDR
jgi:NADH-quinone oxidoreductase subunit N